MKIRWILALASMIALTGKASAQSEAGENMEHDSHSAYRDVYSAATKAKDPAAMMALGIMYEQGMGVAADMQQAFHWYLSAAAAGNAESMNRLGLLYSQGRGVPQDFVAAKGWYQRAAENGSADASNNVATLYFYGLGVPQDYAKAAEILKVVAEQGDPAAMNKLGAMLQDGLGVTKNLPLARDLFRRSAEQGYAPAMMNLGRVYTNAHEGKESEIRGYVLLRAAIESGLPSSMASVAYYELGAAAARLSPKELKKAQDMVERETRRAPVSPTATPAGDDRYVSLRSPR